MMSTRRPTSRSATAALLAMALIAWLPTVGEGTAHASTGPNDVHFVNGTFFEDPQTGWPPSAVNGSLALDAGGGEHMVVDRRGSDGMRWAGYGACPSANCMTDEGWPLNTVLGPARLKAPSQLRLAPGGKPRVLLATSAADDLTTYHYAACEGSCTAAGTWTVLNLGSVFNKPGDVQGVYRDHSFALDPQGRPRFVYSSRDAAGAARLHYASCDTGCTASVANWTKTTVSQGTGAVSQPISVHYESLALDFTSSGQPRIAGYVVERPSAGPEVAGTAYLECNTACGAPAPATGPNPNWAVTRLADRLGGALVLRVDKNGAPHIVTAGELESRSPLTLLRCPTGCAAAANWTSAPVGVAAADPDLAFDTHNRPHVAFKGDAGVELGYARCVTACAGSTPSWDIEEIQDRAFGLDVDASCQGEPWRPATAGHAPSLALDPLGSPRVIYTIRHSRVDCAGQVETTTGARIDRFRAPAGPGRYTPLPPARILDTRFGIGGVSQPAGSGTVDVQVTGRGGIPASGVRAVAMNVTVTEPAGAGYLTIHPAGKYPYPDGGERPLVANVSFVQDQTVPNLVVVEVGVGGKVSLFNSTRSHVIFDVAGWYSEVPAGNDGRYQPLVPARILDSRNGTGGGVRLGPGASFDMQVTGRGGVPTTGVAAVVLNVAVTETTATSFLTVYPAGATRPGAANVNFNANNTVSNRVVAKLGTGGKATIFNHAGSTDVIVDVNGWYTDASVAGGSGVFSSLTGSRLNGPPPLAANSTAQVQVTGRGGVPESGVGAVVLSVTVVKPPGAGYLTLFTTGATKPFVSDLNFQKWETRTNLAVVKVGAEGKVSVYSSAAADVFVDIVGWYAT